MSNVILSSANKTILDRIIELGEAPHLLFHGPPGTGKTTSAMNLVNAIHAKHAAGGKECLIHLNASDDRGVDVIRQQIERFVNSEGLFKRGARFVILDEADYMTRCAQQSLRRLIQTTDESGVTFCLICNYATRIDASLREELVTLRFHCLPTERIKTTLQAIASKEGIHVKESVISAIMRTYGSDIRSMINHLQAHQSAPDLVCRSPYAYWDVLLQETSAPRGLQAEELLTAARTSGTPVVPFIRALLNSAVRTSNQITMDGARILDLAATLASHHQVDEEVIAAHCASELQLALSPQRSARSRSLELHELGGDGECGNSNPAPEDNSGSASLMVGAGIGNGTDTPDIL